MTMTRISCLVVAALLVVARPAAPTTVLAPTFDDLVTRAESVFVAHVVDMRSIWVNSRSGRSIVTDVTFGIERTLKGPTYTERSLEFLGGTVGDDTLHVSGMPQFHINDRDVLFVADSGGPASPLVGFWYGRFRVQRDVATGVSMIRTHDGRPLASLADVGNPKRAATVAPLRTLSLDDFLNAVDTKVRALGRQ